MLMTTDTGNKTYSSMLTIAGSDCSGGAGLQADIKTATLLGVFAATAVTAVTVQTSAGVSHVSALDPETVAAQVRAVMDDIAPGAVKTGMFGSPSNIVAAAGMLRSHAAVNVVVDPVMISTSGKPLCGNTDEAADAMKSELFPLATIVTPNAAEASYLFGIDDAEKVDEEMYVRNCKGISALLLKGGDREGSTCRDILLFRDKSGVFCRRVYESMRTESHNTHGTGCVLSSAIAAFLAKGQSLENAVGNAKKFVDKAIRLGAGYTHGKRGEYGPLYLVG